MSWNVKPAWMKCVVQLAGAALCIMFAWACTTRHDGHVAGMDTPGAGVGPNVRADYYTRGLHDTSLSVGQRIRFGDSLIHVREWQLPWETYAMLEQLLASGGEYGEAERMYAGLLARIPADSLRIRYASMWRVAKYRFMAGRQREAARAAYALLHEPKPDTLRYYDLNAHTLLVDFYNFARDTSMSRRHLRAGFALIHSPFVPGPGYGSADSSRYEGLFHRLAAYTWLDAGNADSAYMHLEAARRAPESASARIANQYIMADIARLKGDGVAAEAYYREAVDANTGNPNRNFAYVKYLEYLLAKGDLAMADSLRFGHPELEAGMKGTVLEASHLGNMAEYHRLKGEWRERGDALARQSELRDSLHAASMSLSVAEEPGNGGEKCGNLPVTDVPGPVLPIAVGIVCMATGAAAGLLFSRRKKQIPDVAGVEFGSGVYPGLTDESPDKRDVSLMGLQIERAADALRRLEGIVSDPAASTASKMEAVAAELKDLERDRRVWTGYASVFNEANGAFFDRLRRVCPGLTQAELRMCAYIRMGLTTKEISALTHRSPRTVEAIKYNLRKKLAPDVSTSDFLRTI